MANIHGIEVSSQIFNLEDTTARSGVETNANNIGDIQDVVPTSASSSNKLATETDVSATTDVTSGDINFTQSFISAQSGGYAKWQKSGKIVKVSFYLVNVTETQTADKTIASGLPIPALDRSIGDISYLNGLSGVPGQASVTLMVNSSGGLITQGASLPSGILHGAFVYIAQ